MECEAFGSHEWWGAYDWVEQVVVNKLSYRDPSGLVDLEPIPPLSEIKFQELINVFCLTICFWVKSSWELNINVHVKAYLFPEITDKLEIIIQYNRVRSTVFLIKFSEPGAVYTDCIDFPHKHEHDIFWEVIHNNHYIDANLSMNVDEWRQADDKVNCKMLKSFLRYWQWY